MTGEIHEDHPFVLPEDDRDPTRRLRGRLTAPVTIVTAGAGRAAAGLTVSSLMVSEGNPGRVYFLLGPASDLFDVIQDTGRFVVHVLEARHRKLSDVFAGLRPSPGGVFAGVETAASEWGPVLADVTNRAYCTEDVFIEESFSVLVSAAIDRVEVADLATALAYYRGRYRALD